MTSYIGMLIKKWSRKMNIEIIMEVTLSQISLLTSMIFELVP